MRHKRRANNISRDPAHRGAMVKNLVVSLFEHERIKTSPRKATAARGLAEKLITLGKRGTVHARRLAISRLGNKAAVRKLFTELGPRYAGRNGGYTRVLRLPETIRLPQSEAANTFKRGYGRRLGDGSAQVYLELVEAEVSPRAHSSAERRANRKRRRRDFFEGTEKPKKEADSGSETPEGAEIPGATEEKKPKKKTKAKKVDDEKAKEPKKKSKSAKKPGAKKKSTRKKKAD